MAQEGPLNLGLVAQPSEKKQLVPGSLLTSQSSTYQVQSFLGQGTYGKVAKCLRIEDKRTVAVKLMRRQSNNKKQVDAEVANLRRLKSLDLNRCNLVQFYNDFIDKSHVCLVFELLDKSLYDFMKERSFQPLLLMQIRPIVQQLANGLSYLKAAEMIHADLKLENVMLVNHIREPYRVKIIDFGLACKVSATRVGSYIQTRTIRSPEIILGAPFNEAIDIWSLGCIGAQLFLGNLLYPGSCEYDMLRYITETQGKLPHTLLSIGCKTSRFFQRCDSAPANPWKLKTPEEFRKQTGIQPTHTRNIKVNSLDEIYIRAIINTEGIDRIAEKSDVRMFVELLKGMLHLDAANRFMPHQVLDHPFIQMLHMANRQSQSSYVRSCFALMEICRNSTASSHRSARHYRSRSAYPERHVIRLCPYDIGQTRPKGRPDMSYQDNLADHSTGSFSNKRRSALVDNVGYRKKRMDYNTRYDDDDRRRCYHEGLAGPSTSKGNGSGRCGCAPSHHRRRKMVDADQGPCPADISNDMRLAQSGLKMKADGEGV